MEYSFLKLQARRIPKPSFRFLLVIPMGVAVAAAVWYPNRPMLEELKTKDAHRYELMVQEASHFHFINAWKQCPADYGGDLRILQATLFLRVCLTSPTPC